MQGRQGYSNTELRILDNSDKLVYLTSRITTLGCMQHLASLRFLLFSYRRYSRSNTSTPGVSINLSNELSRIVARFLNSNMKCMAGLQYHAIKNKYHNHSMN